MAELFSLWKRTALPLGNMFGRKMRRPIRSAHCALDSRIAHLLRVRQIAQGLHPEGRKEGFGSDERIGRAAPWLSRAGADTIALGQPPNQVTADSAPENLPQPVATDWLEVGKFATKPVRTCQ